MAKPRLKKTKPESVDIDVNIGKEARENIEERLQEGGGPPVQDVKHVLPPLFGGSDRRSVWPGILSFLLVVGLAVGVWFGIQWWNARTISVASFIPEDASLALFLPESDATITALSALPGLESYTLELIEPYGFTQEDFTVLVQHEIAIAQQGSGRVQTLMVAVRRSDQVDTLFERLITPIGVDNERSVSALLASADGVPREIVSEKGDVLYAMPHRRAWVVSTDIEVVRAMVAAARGEQVSLADDPLVRTASDVLDVQTIPTLYSASTVSRIQWQPLWDQLFGASSLSVQSLFVAESQFMLGISQSVESEQLGWDLEMVLPRKGNEASIAPLLEYVDSEASVVTTIVDQDQVDTAAILNVSSISLANDSEAMWVGWTPNEWADRTNGPVVVMEQDDVLVLVARLEDSFRQSVLAQFETDLTYAYATAFPSVATLELDDGTEGQQYLPNEDAFTVRDQVVDGQQMRLIVTTDAYEDSLPENNEDLLVAGQVGDGLGMGYTTIGEVVIVSLRPQSIADAISMTSAVDQETYADALRMLSEGGSPTSIFDGCVSMDASGSFSLRIVESLRGSIVWRDMRIDQPCSDS